MQQNLLFSIKQLFDQCLPLTEQERQDTFNDCGLVAEVIEEVKQLLTIVDSEQDQHSEIINQQLLDMSHPLAKGQVLGAYKIEQEIGRGGMGIVFLAHRADGSYEQKVAIKIAPSFASSAEHKRFQQERQILAQLQHPNIAVLLDGGATTEQRPYLVMEYIEGQSITQYCQIKQLSLSERIHLFLDVCQAVSYAHSHLVVHGDIKPENVLVDEQGQVKLLDFGVSKILKTDNNQLTNSLANITLAYASPEQVKGEQITTATDVYGLGSLLYEMLAGQAPHNLSEQSPEKIINTICLNEPERMSVCSQKNEHLIAYQSLKGDLDNIVIMALDKLPSRRYVSAQDLSRDLKCYLYNEEVTATKPSLGYKLKKLLLRHPLPFGLSSALAISLVGGLIVSLNLSNSLSIEKQKLEQQVATSTEVISLLTNMFDAAAPNNTRGDDISVKELIYAAEQHTNESLQQAPDAKARLLNVLASVQRKIGEEVASANLRKAAFELKQQHQLELTATDYAHLAMAYITLSEFDLSKQALDSALSSIKQPDSYEMALVQSILGNFYRFQGQEVTAIDHYQQALAILVTINYPDDAWSLTISRQIAICYDAIGQYDKARQVLEKTINRKQEVLGSDHPSLVNDNTMLGLSYQKLGLSNDHLEIVQSNYQLAKKLYSANKGTFVYVVLSYVYELNNRGLFDQALAVLAETITDELTDARYQGLELSTRAVSYDNIGLPQQALADFKQSLSLLTPVYGNSLNIMFPARYSSATVLGQYADKKIGIEQLKSLEQEVLNTWGKTPPITSVWLGLAKIHLHHREISQVSNYLARVTELFSAQIPDRHPAYKELHQITALFNESNENWQQALNSINKAIEVRNANLKQQPDQTSIGDSLIFLQKALYLAHLNQKYEATKLFNLYVPTLEELLPVDSTHHQLINKVGKLINKN